MSIEERVPDSPESEHGAETSSTKSTERALRRRREYSESDGSNPVPELQGYQMLNLLGRGGHGDVWRARQKGTGRDVAVKLLHLEELGARTLSRFVLEVEVTARLDHPNIARLYESRLHAGQCAYAMEYVDGCHLDDWLRADKPGQTERLQLFIRVCRAVQHAHQRGVIHRDLKPSNIMVTSAGIPKVLDFGLAKIMAASELESIRSEMTQQGAVLGTPQYMAPEQLRGDSERVDTRTDVYALGVILYRMIVGRHPYSFTGGLAKIMTEVLERDPCRPRSVEPGIERDLETVILHALAREPEDRYASAGALADDIQRFLDGEPIHARTQSLSYIVRRKLAKHRGKVAVAALAAVAMVGFTVAAYVAIVRQRNAAVVAEKRAEQRLQEARRFVHTLVQDMEDALDKGPTAARKTLLRTVSGHLDALYSGADERPELLGDRADILVRIANVQLALLDSSTDNDISDALAGYDRAQALYQRAESLDGDAVTLMQWAGLLGKRARARGQSSDPAGMETDAQAAMDLLRQAMNADAANADAARVLWLEVALAWAVNLQQNGQPEAAAALHARMFEAIEALDQTRLDDDLTRIIARAHASRAWRLGAGGDYDEALAEVERGLRLIAARAPWQQSPATRQVAAILHEYAAWLQEERQDARASLVSAQQSHRMFEGLWAGDPENRGLQNWVAWTGQRVADQHFALGELTAAEAASSQVVRLYDAMSATREPRTLRDAASAHGTSAKILITKGSLTEAAQHLDRAHALLDGDELRADDSVMILERRLRVLLADIRLNLWQRRYQRVDRLVSEALQLSRRIDSDIFQRWQFDLLLLRAKALARRGDTQAGRVALDEAEQALTGADAGGKSANPAMRQLRAAWLTYLRAHFVRAESPARARTLLTDSLRELGEISALTSRDTAHNTERDTERRTSRSATTVRELIDIRSRTRLALARIAAEQRDVTAAREHLRESLAEMTDLVQRWPDHWHVRLELGRAWALDGHVQAVTGRSDASDASYQRAASEFDRILTLDGSNAEAKRARADLPAAQPPAGQ